MYCSECETYIDDNVNYCPNCGVKARKTIEDEAEAEQGERTFLDCVDDFFTKYFDHSGRTTREEFWNATIFNLALITVLFWLWNLTDVKAFDTAMFLYETAIFIPCVMMSIRRLHDVGKSGLALLYILIPFAGIIILAVKFFSKSGPDNEYGPVRSVKKMTDSTVSVQ